MKSSLSTLKLQNTTKDTLVLFGFEDKDPIKLYGKDLSTPVLKAIKDVLSLKDFEGKTKSTQTLYTGSSPKRIVLIGLGKQKEFNLDIVRKGIGNLVRSLADSQVKEISVPAFNLPTDEKDNILAIAESIVMANHGFYMYDEKKRGLQSFIVPVSKQSKEFSAMFKRANVIGKALNGARDLANYPGSIATPQYFGNVAKSFGKGKLKVKVFDKKAIQKLGMHALLAVNQGSMHEPRFIVMEYNGNPSSKEKIALVGKGITFDSGGLNLKIPSVYMESMKHDSSGAAIVLFSMVAAADLNLKVNLVACMPLTENMPGNTAYKPGDIIKTMSGKTIEVLNTDAEGRVVLSDALFYVQRYKPKCIIDIATLTGAAMVALGTDVAAIVGNDDKLVKDLVSSGTYTNDRLWEFPMFVDYGEMIKSNFADIKNVVSNGFNGGGVMTAGKFLEHFVGNYPWAHIDIGGAGWTDNPHSYRRHGATAFGMRAILDYVIKQQ